MVHEDDKNENDPYVDGWSRFVVEIPCRKNSEQQHGTPKNGVTDRIYVMYDGTHHITSLEGQHETFAVVRVWEVRGVHHRLQGYARRKKKQTPPCHAYSAPHTHNWLPSRGWRYIYIYIYLLPMEWSESCRVESVSVGFSITMTEWDTTRRTNKKTKKERKRGHNSSLRSGYTSVNTSRHVTAAVAAAAAVVVTLSQEQEQEQWC